MHSLSFAPWLFAALSLWLPSADAFSACDDLDVVFMIDTAAFEHPFDSVDFMDVIMRVIEDGSSEDDGFSVVFYGDNIPNDQNAVVISYTETQPLHSRAREEELIKAEVTAAYEAVEACRLSGTSDDCSSVSLMDAFEQATRQPKPERQHAKADKLRGAGYVTDQDDDATRFIFVDYMNEVIPDSAVASEGSLLCELLEYEIFHPTDRMHFLFGQEFDADALEVDCGFRSPENLLTQRMFDINAVVDEYGESTLLEMVFRWTCPAWVVSETEGYVNLGNHDQWMDIDSIIECNLVNAYEDDVTHAVELSADSYVKVKDIEDSLNTFKTNDFLLEYPAIHDALEARGCWLPVLKILEKVEVPDEACDEADCTIVRLKVQVPESPDEYIDEASTTTNTQVASSRRRAQDGNLDEDDLDLLRRQLVGVSVSGSQSLLDEHWSYTYTANYSKDFENVYEPKALWSPYSEPKFTFSGDGTITTTLDVEVDMTVDAQISYEKTISCWGTCTTTKMRAELIADWSLKAYIGAEFVGNMQFDVADILKYSHGQTYLIASAVPIYIDHYITLNASVTMVPLRLYAGVECNFGETHTFGVEYDSEVESSDSSFFQTRVAKENSCTPVLQIGSEAENAEECPATELGFDIEVTPQIGAIIYWALAEVYVKPKLVVPFRITMPEMRDAVCAGAASSCDNSLMASFNVAMYMQIYLGGAIVQTWEYEQQVGGDISLIPTTALGCTTLDGPLSLLDTFYRWSGCCADTAAAASDLLPSEIVIDLSYASSHWVGVLAVLLAALLLLNVYCFMVRSRSRTARYVHVAAECDSEEFTDNEAKAINVDLAA